MSPLNHLEDASRSCALPRSRRLRGVQGLAFLVALVLTTGHAAADQPSVDEVGTPLGNRPSVCGDRLHPTAQGYQVPGRKPNSQLPWKFLPMPLSEEHLKSSLLANEVLPRDYKRSKPTFGP